MMGFDGGQQQRTTLFPNRNHWLQCSGLLWQFFGGGDRERDRAPRDQPLGQVLAQGSVWLVPAQTERGKSPPTTTASGQDSPNWAARQTRRGIWERSASISTRHGHFRHRGSPTGPHSGQRQNGDSVVPSVARHSWTGQGEQAAILRPSSPLPLRPLQKELERHREAWKEPLKRIQDQKSAALVPRASCGCWTC